ERSVAQLRSTISSLARTIRLRSVVALLVLAIVAPLGLLAAFSVQRAWRRQLANVDRQNVATVRAISVAVDQHIDRTTSALDVLGELHALDSPDCAPFGNAASGILPYQAHWSAVLLADPSGRVIDGVPDQSDGAAHVDGAPWARATAAKAATTVSNLFTLPRGSGHYVMVATPVIRQGQVRLVLGARVDSRSFGAILRQQEAPPNGAVAIVDADHRVVSRNVEEEQYVGTEVTQAFVDATAARPTAPWRTTMRDGRPTY